MWFMGVAYNTRRGFWVGLPVPETSFEKLGPMISLAVQWTWYSSDACGNDPRYHEGLSQNQPPSAVPGVAKTEDFYAVRVTHVSP